MIGKIKYAIKLIGSVSFAAATFNVSTVAVSDWPFPKPLAIYTAVLAVLAFIGLCVTVRDIVREEQ